MTHYEAYNLPMQEGTKGETHFSKSCKKQKVLTCTNPWKNKTKQNKTKQNKTKQNPDTCPSWMSLFMIAWKNRPAI